MKPKTLPIAILFITVVCCRDENSSRNPYQTCNTLLSPCAKPHDVGYCTFGYKWGGGNPFQEPGPEKSGPNMPGGVVTFSFVPAGIVFNTHSQMGITTLSLSESITICDPKEEIRKALGAWREVANIEFREIEGESVEGEIRFMAGKITQGGVGFGNFTDDICAAVAGQVAIGIPTRSTCEGFYSLVLHEIGHVLGLGHVSSNNVMNPAVQLTELQEGDIEGVVSIYGAR